MHRFNIIVLFLAMQTVMTVARPIPTATIAYSIASIAKEKTFVVHLPIRHKVLNQIAHRRVHQMNRTIIPLNRIEKTMAIIGSSLITAHHFSCDQLTVSMRVFFSESCVDYRKLVRCQWPSNGGCMLIKHNSPSTQFCIKWYDGRGKNATCTKAQRIQSNEYRTDLEKCEISFFSSLSRHCLID